MVFRVRDACAMCRPQDLDLFQHVFDGIVGPTGIGRMEATWRWVGDGEEIGPSQSLY